MSFERKIQKALAEHSKWQGSADRLWAKIAPEIEKKTPWWRKGRIWAGTLAAAVLVVFFLRPFFNQPPPDFAAPIPEMRMRSLSVEQGALITEPGALIGISVKATPTPLEAGQGPPLSLFIRRITEDGRRLPLQGKRLFVNLSEKDLSREGPALTILAEAPLASGRYELKIEGTVLSEGKLYEIRGEREIQVLQKEEGR